jgi:hypothetical protein
LPRFARNNGFTDISGLGLKVDVAVLSIISSKMKKAAHALLLTATLLACSDSNRAVIEVKTYPTGGNLHCKGGGSDRFRLCYFYGFVVCEYEINIAALNSKLAPPFFM